MKDILGGYMEPPSNPSCSTGKCDLYVQALGKTVSGTCDTKYQDNTHWTCVCTAQGYETNNGGTACVYAS